MNDTAPDIPISLYVHFPWCAKKCPYCDFNSHESNAPVPFKQYIDALIKDLDQELTSEPRRRLVSIFMGGGTPSLFPDREIARLVSAIRERLDISDSEITIEANPGTFDQAQFDGYREAGINRISIGAQSFSADALQKLGRIHNPDEIITAYEGARKAGFDRINIDLMHGLPGQTLDLALSDLKNAVSLKPEHLSWYQLTIEPNTVFYKRPPRLPLEETLDDILFEGLQALQRAKYLQYETSAFAKPGEEALHNLNYWQFGDYLGIGAGAHGKVTRQGRIVRTSKTRVPSDYLDRAETGDQSSNESTVEQKDLVLEFLMNSLRLTHGFNLNLFESRTGLERAVLEPFIKRATDQGLLICSKDEVVTTPKGRIFLNELLLLID